MSAAEKITDPKTIREWAQSRGGRPAKHVEAPGGGENKLTLFQQDETKGGGASRFFKFVER